MYVPCLLPVRRLIAQQYHVVQATPVSGSHPEREGHVQERGNEETPGLNVLSEDMTTLGDEDAETIITGMRFTCVQFAKIANVRVGIRATDVTAGLGRIPAGFYVAVQHNNLEWRTANKPVFVNNDAIEWNGPIPM